MSKSIVKDTKKKSLNLHDLDQRLEWKKGIKVLIKILLIIDDLDKNQNNKDHYSM